MTRFVTIMVTLMVTAALHGLVFLILDNHSGNRLIIPSTVGEWCAIVDQSSCDVEEIMPQVYEIELMRIEPSQVTQSLREYDILRGWSVQSFRLQPTKTDQLLEMTLTIAPK